MLQLRPTFSESWYRVVTLKPRLRVNAQISRQHYRGERWYVVRDPAGNQFHRLSDAAYRFVGLLDGTRTVGEAWDLVGGQLADDAPTQPEVIQILSQLYSANLIETDITPDSQVLLRRHKKQLQRKMQGRLMNLMFPRIPLWDPDRFLCRWLPVVKPFLSKWGALLWIATIIGAIAVVLPRWGDLQSAASNATDPKNWIFLWVTFVLIKFIHELGHAFACRRFGGECHEMGIMFLIFVPTPYVDASTAWSFPSKYQRMFVGAGGMVIELFVASLCAFVWVLTRPGVPLFGIPINELAYNAMLIASVTTVIFNANPLLRYDGYYMLSDFLEIPNLQQKSKEYCLGLIKRHVFRIRQQQPLPPVGQRIQLFFYGILSSVYRVFVGVMIILVVAYEIPVLGTLMALGGLITWLVVPTVKTFRYLTIEPELHRKRGRGWAFTLGVIAAVVVLVGVIKFPYNVDIEGIVEPRNKEVLNTLQPGFVESIVAKDGQYLQKGDPIVVLKDPALDAQITQKGAEVRAAEADYKKFQFIDVARAKIAAEQVDVLKSQLKDFQRQNDDLTVRAKIAGSLIAPKLHQFQGRYLQKGEPVATVATINPLMIYATVPQTESGAISQALDNRTEVRLVGNIEQKLQASGVERVPAAERRVKHAALTFAGGGLAANDQTDQTGTMTATPEFQIRVKLSNPDNLFVPGQRAYVRLKLEDTYLAHQWYRKFLQVTQSHRQTQSKLVG